MAEALIGSAMLIGSAFGSSIVSVQQSTSVLGSSCEQLGKLKNTYASQEKQWEAIIKEENLTKDLVEQYGNDLRTNTTLLRRATESYEKAHQVYQTTQTFLIIFTILVLVILIIIKRTNLIHKIISLF